MACFRPNDKVQLAVRPSNAVFHPPAYVVVSMLTFCAGQRLTRVREFLAIQKRIGRDVAKSNLFLGCRRFGEDLLLYADDDLKAWVDLGIEDVHPAFSSATSTDQSLGYKYVQE
ncbi:uncharacterized protein PHACADRAFT_266587 [Phanerochaete carnosa HHB-10118-sp]|uniref:Uncharacterized protein n=1 Tax=Phanerochaete carnosa (strain HHB-10118-sp) TaxID=650164 RepID=K5WCW5_PHACS|nr:uncharacterized protein PHACADRAFT_266587 [Phanerochaete carnosa HHB-10118-sp]EKM48027.1 hypothetical protein PHACADRAFT_266587 [Phanerochaete carnosa HHB-10118-sp]